MPTPDAIETFRRLMAKLMPKSKEELKSIAENPATPDVIAEIIRNHPALLGESEWKADDLGESNDHASFVRTTEEIIVAHGFRHTYEWEYECDGGRPKLLRIWLGKTRTKKNLRVLTLTEEEVVRAQAVMPTLPPPAAGPSSA